MLKQKKTNSWTPVGQSLKTAVSHLRTHHDEIQECLVQEVKKARDLCVVNIKDQNVTLYNYQKY